MRAVKKAFVFAAGGRPGKTKEALIELLRIGAEEMLMTAIRFEPGSIMTTVSVREPEWAAAADE
jgi:hypothetical protein